MASKEPKIVLPDGSPVYTQESRSEGLVVMDRERPRRLFLLPYQATNLFPGVLTPFILQHEGLKRAVEEASRLGHLIGLVPSRKESDEALGREDLYDIGLAGMIVRRLNLPDESVNALINIQHRVRIDRIVRMTPFPVAEVSWPEETYEEGDVEIKVLMRSIINGVKQISRENPFVTEELKLVMVNLDHPARLADVVASVLQLEPEDYLDLLRTHDVKERLNKVMVHLSREMEMADLQRRLQTAVSDRMQKSQREFMLREQLKEIQRELGYEEGMPPEESLYEKKIKESAMPEPAEKLAREEVQKMSMLHEASPEYAVSRAYLDWLCALPWSKTTMEANDLDGAEKILESGHYGIPEVKTRILEYLAVLKLTKKTTGTILCLVGPPGVGKTSLGRSIAKAMGRKFIRFSVGGMRDEAEIKGHRRTYVGAMPGKIIQEMKKAESSNPLFMIDEIDKLAVGFQGDPASALLEALDPEQNKAFLDHYIDTPFDLSKVVFIATANTLDTIPDPLLDRMEVLRLPGYIEEEKLVIARKHIIPRQLARHGLKRANLTLEMAAMRLILREYTQEAGLRHFDREIEKICRKVAARHAHGKTRKVRITAASLQEFLGRPRVFPELAGGPPTPGVTTGLAWTPYGGAILNIEAIAVPATEAREPKMTGSMGQVMSESASLAFTYARAAANRMGVGPDWFAQNHIHLHMPAGATPKDGPSAGVAMAVSMMSLASGRAIDPFTAMTGELTLTGKVLPVGGIKEKVIAARHAGVKRVVLPKANGRDLEDIPAYIRSKLKFVLVEHVGEVFDLFWPATREKKAQPPKTPVKAARPVATRKNPAKPTRPSPTTPGRRRAPAR